jgi:KDO2-lipid IV(A) lauroyltransferase
MYKPSSSPDIDKLILNARKRAGTELVPTSFRGVARVCKMLESGGITIILPDQQPELLESGQFVRFFGVPALTMKLVPSLIIKTDARVLAVYVLRLPEGRGFEIVFHEPCSDVYSEDLDIAIAAVNCSMERCIREVPAQYHWEYPRFRRDENGVFIYKELAKRAKS